MVHVPAGGHDSLCLRQLEPILPLTAWMPAVTAREAFDG